jgi:hypothetical protein
MLTGSDSLVNGLILVCLGYAALLPLYAVNFQCCCCCCLLFGTDTDACPFVCCLLDTGIRTVGKIL